MISLRDLTFGLILFKSIFPGHAAAAAIDSNRDAKVDEIARRSLETVVVTRSAGAVNIGLTTLTSATIATRSLVPIVATDLALTTLTSATIITRSLVPVVTVAAQPTAVVSVVTLGTASLSLASAAASAPPLVPMMNTPDTPTAQDYALKTNTTWYWTYDGSDVPIAKLECGLYDAPDGRLLGLERLMNKIRYVSCVPGGFTMKFEDAASYNSAEQNWDWVNQADPRYIEMVVIAPSCSNGNRMPYRVTAIQMVDSSLMMGMTASVEDFPTAFPKYQNLKFDTNGLQADMMLATGKLRKRLNVDSTIDLTQDFAGKPIFTENVGGVDLSVVCARCGTTGSIHATGELDIIGTRQITFIPSGLSATVGVGLMAAGSVTLSKDVNLLTVPLPGGFSILGGVVNLGPILAADIQASVTFGASAELDLGSVTLSLSDQAADGSQSQVLVDLNNLGNSGVKGFTPSFSSQGPSLSAQVSANANISPVIRIDFEGSAFGQGAALGIALAAPVLDANAVLNGGDCPAGVQIDAGLSAQLMAFAGFGAVADVARDNTLSIIGTSTQIFSTCITLFGADALTPAPAVIGPIPGLEAPAPAAAPAATAGAGGVVGTTLAQGACQSVFGTAADIPTTCDTPSPGCEQAITGFANICCPSGTSCAAATVGGVSGFCCT